MSDDIEVTITLPREVVDDVRAGGLIEAQGYDLTIPEAVVAAIEALPAPAPLRSEYPLQHVSHQGGNTSVNDSGVVLVPAHSLRSGDEVEWAPGDWRAVLRVYAGTGYVSVDFAGDEGTTFGPSLLVAVRRSGVTG